MARRGAFDVTLVPRGWFDDTLYPVGWFADELIPPPLDEQPPGTAESGCAGSDSVSVDAAGGDRCAKRARDRECGSWQTTPLIDAPSLLTFPEDFAGSLPLEEPAQPAIVILVDVTTMPPGGEDIGAAVTAGLDEYAFPPFVPGEPVWIGYVVPEDFAGAVVDESGTCAWIVTELPPIVWPVGEDFRGVLTVDETGIPPPVLTEPFWIVASPPEDFAGILTVDETSTPPPVSTDIPLVVWAVTEDFGGAHPTEEASPWLWIAPDVAPTVIVLPEDFAG